MYSFEELNNCLRNMQETFILEQEFAKILVVPQGGRILGVSLDEENLLWVNPNPRVCMMGDDWNLGGIRTWIAPERNYFYSNPESFEGWSCPIGIDPANYKIIKKEETTINLISDIEAKNFATDETLRGILSKRIEIISTNEVGNIRYVKLRIHSILQMHTEHSPVAIWSIIQVPTNDTKKSRVKLPINVANTIPYFGQIPEDYFNYNETSIEFILDGKRELKLGIPPEDFPNPSKIDFCYTYEINDKKALISVNSLTSATNQEECLDVAKYNPNGLKGVIQFYNSNKSESGLEYGELEIHSKPTKHTNGILMTENIITLDFSIEK